MPNPAAAPFVLGAAALSGAAYYYNNNRRRSSASSTSSSTSDNADLKTYNVNYNPSENATTVKPTFSEINPQYGKDTRWAQDASRPGSWKWV